MLEEQLLEFRDENESDVSLHEAPGISLTPSEIDRFSACSLLIFMMEVKLLLI